MRPIKHTLVKWYFVVLATALALVPTLMALADGGGSSSD
jgi:hypothetical protein